MENKIPFGQRKFILLMKDVMIFGIPSIQMKIYGWDELKNEHLSVFAKEGFDFCILFDDEFTHEQLAISCSVGGPIIDALEAILVIPLNKNAQMQWDKAVNNNRVASLNDWQGDVNVN